MEEWDEEEADRRYTEWDSSFSIPSSYSGSLSPRALM